MTKLLVRLHCCEGKDHPPWDDIELTLIPPIDTDEYWDDEWEDDIPPHRRVNDQGPVIYWPLRSWTREAGEA